MLRQIVYLAPQVCDGSAGDQAGPELQSFNSLILRWKQLGIDLLVTSLSDQQQLTLMKELRKLAFNPKVFSTYAIESFAPSSSDRKYFEGTRYTHPVNSAENSEDNQALTRKLLKREGPGQRSNINAYFAYDGLRFLRAGLEHCRGPDAECLFRYFTTLGTQQGVSGEMRFQPNGALTRPYGLKQVLQGEFAWLQRSKL